MVNPADNRLNSQPTTRVDTVWHIDGQTGRTACSPPPTGPVRPPPLRCLGDTDRHGGAIIRVINSPIDLRVREGPKTVNLSDESWMRGLDDEFRAIVRGMRAGDVLDTSNTKRDSGEVHGHQPDHRYSQQCRSQVAVGKELQGDRDDKIDYSEQKQYAGYSSQ